MKEEAVILDPCCGSKMFWFDKDNPMVMYGDIRTEQHTLCDGRSLVIAPDMEMDFTNLPFEDKRFKLVVFDPPHMVKLGVKSWLALKYGKLNSNWRDNIRDGFNECIRVLDDHGVMIFKWNEYDVKLSDVLALLPQQPLFGHTTGRQSKTIWLCFMKTLN